MANPMLAIIASPIPVTMPSIFPNSSNDMVDRVASQMLMLSLTNMVTK